MQSSQYQHQVPTDGLSVFVAHPEKVWVKGVIVASSSEGFEIQTIEEDLDEEKEGEGDGKGQTQEGMHENGPQHVFMLADQWGSNLLPANPSSPSNAATWDNLCEMTYLHGATVLDNLRRRYKDHQIYTEANHVIISLNPYCFSDIYSAETQAQYSDPQHLDNFSPHIYKISCRAIADLVQCHANQTVVVTGESGSGKTEVVKLLLTHIANLASSANSLLVQKILSANSILESFGNAKTSKNDNSSRYGKFLSLKFNEEYRVTGATIASYLLEKNRVTVRSFDSESTFHCFYSLFSFDDTSVKTDLSFKSGHENPSDFFYLQGSISTRAPVLSQILLDLECCLSYTKEQAMALMKIVSAVLWCGELETFSHQDETGINNEVEDETLGIIADLLGIAKISLQKFLQFRTINVCGQELETALSIPQRRHRRDAFASELYGMLFSHVIQTINHSLAQEPDHKQPSTLSATNTVALLDIFGFEVLHHNSLEQLLINYANEKLHIHFVHYTVLSVQREYEEEEITFPSFSFPDLDLVVSAMEVRHGVIDTLHEQVMVSSGSDSAVLKSIRKQSEDYETKNNNPQQTHKNSGMEVHRSMKGFVVRHFAGSVEYEIEGMVNRNRDCSLTGLDGMLAGSSNIVVAILCPHDSESNPGVKASFIRSDSIAKRFKSQLQEILHNLQNTKTHYIRCVRPNANQRPNLFDASLVKIQLDYSGIIEAATVARSAYPCKVQRTVFVKSFQCLIPPKQRRIHNTENGEDLIHSILSLSPKLSATVDSDRSKFVQLGKSKIFLDSEVLLSLEQAKYRLLQSTAIKIQAAWRGHKAVTQVSIRKTSVTLIQRQLHVAYCRRDFLRIKHQMVKLQSFVRMWLCMKMKRLLANSARLVQRHWRNKIVRDKARTLRNHSAVLLQSLVRGRISRKLVSEKTLAKKQIEALALIASVQQIEQQQLTETRAIIIRNQSIQVIQRLLRGVHCRRDFLRIKHQTVKLQSFVRMWRCRKMKRLLANSVRLVQRHWRNKIMRDKARLRNHSAVLLQSLVRGRISRRFFSNQVGLTATAFDNAAGQTNQTPESDIHNIDTHDLCDIEAEPEDDEDDEDSVHVLRRSNNFEMEGTLLKLYDGNLGKPTLIETGNQLLLKSQELVVQDLSDQFPFIVRAQHTPGVANRCSSAWLRVKGSTFLHSARGELNEVCDRLMMKEGESAMLEQLLLLVLICGLPLVMAL